MITGVAGFIGSHLAEKLISEGHSVYGFDLMPIENAPNLKALKDVPTFHYTQGDIRDPQDVASFYVEDADVLYHLASVVGIKNYVADPLNLVDVVVLGTRYFLEHVIKHNTRFIFSSTSELFGKNPAVPWKEDADRVLGATSVHRWSYSSSKAVCEHMIYGAGEKYNIPFTIVRFFNVYGPRQNPIFVVSQSIQKVLNGEKPLMYDDGTMTRCYTYIDDIIEGLLLIADQKASVGEAINLGNNVASSVKEVIETILEITGSPNGYENLDTNKHYGSKYEDIYNRVPDVKKAYDLLGWKASIQLHEGVAKTVDWARTQNNQ